MKPHWYVVVVLGILVFIYLNTPLTPEHPLPQGPHSVLDIEEYNSWVSFSHIHNDYLMGRLEARLEDYDSGLKKINNIGSGRFVGKINYEGRMRDVAVRVPRGSFEGDFKGSMAGDNFAGEIAGKSKNMFLEGYMRPDVQAPLVSSPVGSEDYSWMWYVGFGLLVLFIWFLKSDGKKGYYGYDDATVDKKLRKFINDEYSSQIWKVLKHKSVPEDSPQWIKIHFNLQEPFGFDCLTIYRIRDRRFTDTSFGVKPYEIDDFWSRKISYEGGSMNMGSPVRRPGRPPKK